MTLLTLVQEYWRFFKDKFWSILVGTLVFAALVVGGRYWIVQSSLNNEAEPFDHLSHVYQEEPAYFRLVLVNEEGSFFTGSYLLDSYLSTPQVVQQIEERSGVSFHQTLAAEQQLELFKSTDYRGAIAGIREIGTDIISLRFQVGKNPEDNLKVAQAYQAFIQDQGLDFLGMLEVELIQEAQIGELNLQPNELRLISSMDALNVFVGMSKKSIIIYSILGLIGGFILSNAWLLFRQVLRPQIVYAFEYGWDLSQHHLVVDQEYQSLADLLADMTQLSKSQPLTILRQQGREIAGHQTLAQMSQLESVDGDLLILIESGQTDKAWYRQQIQLAEFYPDLRIGLVHIYGKEEQ